MINLHTYENRHNTKFPNNPIKVIEKIGNYVYFETEFGLCKKAINHFDNSYHINSAINKNEYFSKAANKIHNNKYDYSKVNYKGSKIKIMIICSKHKIFLQEPSSHLCGNGCPKCKDELLRDSRKMSVSNFIKKANLKHQNKYDYSKIDYFNNTTKITILCPIHQEFKQTPGSHLRGSGCPYCSRILINTYHENNPIGWTTNIWIKTAEKSKNFDSFKVYVIECWNENERFYKVGRTFTTINTRFNSKNMPYNYKIVKVVNGLAKEMYNLENLIKKENKKNKYLPKLKFGGMYECFSKIL